MLPAVTEVPCGSGKVLGIQAEVETSTKRTISVFKDMIKTLNVACRRDADARGVESVKLILRLSFFHTYLFVYF